MGFGSFCKIANIKNCTDYVFENLPNRIKNRAFPEKSVFWCPKLRKRIPRTLTNQSKIRSYLRRPENQIRANPPTLLLIFGFSKSVKNRPKTVPKTVGIGILSWKLSKTLIFSILKNLRPKTVAPGGGPLFGVFNPWHFFGQFLAPMLDLFFHVAQMASKIRLFRSRPFFPRQKHPKTRAWTFPKSIKNRISS